MEARYCIRWPYRARRTYHHYDDSTCEDHWQLEVYLHALGLMKKHNLTSIVDIGCGSGYKLVTYFADYQTLGLEVPENVRLLQKRYPDKQWQVSDSSVKPTISTDVIICADVIEHMVDPDELVTYIKGIPFQYLVLSTPDRKLIYRPWKRGYWGPPRNKAHQREWTLPEFGRYISLHFDVIDHRITNPAQYTQMVICRPQRSLGTAESESK